MSTRDKIAQAKRIVVKVGTSTLTYENGNINLINSYIKKIDFTYHKIYFENKTILFDQIVSLN